MAEVQLPQPLTSRHDYGDAEEAMVKYRESGTRRALKLGNRGPIRFSDTGELHSDIREAYSRCGFFIFERVLDQVELNDIEKDIAELLRRLPVSRGATVDRDGRPALGSGCQARTISWVKPLSDPIGGTQANHGRHPSRMIELDPPEDAPHEIVQVISGVLQFSEAYLRVYGHPNLLRVAEAILGPDFTPFNEVLWVKQPGLGGSVAWHQDGWTHWKSPSLDENTHGFNFMAQLYGCDAENGLWVVPGSHRRGKADIKAMVEQAGSDRLREAVPLICNPGDVAITNRQAIHGSFANTSSKYRVTLNFGFHRRSSVLNVKSGGVHNPITTYTEEYIRSRSRMIMFGINARKERYPDETPYDYAPMKDNAAGYKWDSSRMAELTDYNLQDIGI
ncbi:MAG: phytanoyl-CoA dioxygenase family protein [Gammaproteobacteria bacterium]|nr:phytanoyl-CoA dioxygenase family protein [Gammaproteobacteria bacterium]